MLLICLQWQTDLSISTNRQLIKVRASLGAHPLQSLERQRLLWCFNLMLLTGIIAGQALGAD